MASPDSADNRAKLQTSYQNLSSASKDLNAASDQFSRAVSNLDEALNNLSPGVTAWVTISSRNEEDAPWEEHQERLGFAKVDGRWGLALSRVVVDQGGRVPEEDTQDLWLFNNAPRNLRLKAITYVPKLVDALAAEAKVTARRVNEGAEIALHLADSINAGKENR